MVGSKTQHGVVYLVDMKHGLCNCEAGQDGSACSHQAAVVLHFGVSSINCIPTMSCKSRKEIAVIALQFRILIFT